MQLANSVAGDPALRRHVRQSDRSDAAALQRLLRMGVYVHIHVDWRPPGEWLGTPGFVVYERDEIGHTSRKRTSGDIIACLAVVAEPPPAAWVRVAATESTAGFPQAEAMFAQVLENLDPAVEEISWFLADYWPLHWLERLGFVPVSDVLSFYKDDLSVPSFTVPAGLEIRPLLMEDIPALTEIEAAAFEPRWRYGAKDLYLAWQHSICFDVALLDGEPVAFQFSTGGEGNAHLSRMTVRPDRQGLGIGAGLLARAIESYRLQNIRTVSLNTQSDNMPSRRLYERFGFHPTDRSYAVWSFFINRG